ncbi:MAG: SMC family ATPase [Gemmatimonadaceae bacterium]
MRLARLRLVNFRQHVETQIEFDSGLTGIIGPNGAGKSTILEAIAWALYGGNTARGGNESIRFHRAAPRAPVRVELDFDLAGHRYRVVRGLSTAELFLDGGETPIANSVTTVAEMLQRRIGMTRTEFFNTYFTGQKELAVMQALTAGERAQFLSRVLGYEKLRVAQDLCGVRRKELASEVAGLRSGMPERETVLREERAATDVLREAARAVEAAERLERETGDALSSVAPRWLAAQTGRDERQRIETELAAIDGEDAALGQNAERIERELAQVEEARTSLAPLLPDLAALEEVSQRLEAQRALASSDGRRRALETAREALAAECAAFEEQLERLRATTATEERVTQDLASHRQAAEDAQGKLEARRTEWVRERQEVESRLRALRTQYAELRDQRDKLVTAGEEGDCPTCARPLGEHFRNVLDVIERQLETVEADGGYFRSRLEQLEAMPADITHLGALRGKLQEDVSLLVGRLAQVQGDARLRAQVERDLGAKRTRLGAIAAELATLPEGFDEATFRALDQEHGRLVESTTLANRLSMTIEREPALTREAEASARKRAALNERRAAATARLGAYTIPEGDYAELRQLHDGVAAAHAAAAQQAAAVRAARDLAAAGAARATDARTAYEALEAKVEALEGQRRLHDELHRAYTDLRTDLNFQLRPELSELASAFLTELTDARYTELEPDDRYRILVLEDGVPKPVISGGEEDVANLVLRLAISQMIAERAGQAFSLLVLDEVFGSLDDVRRQNVVELLRGLQDRFDQVIVITHIEGVRDGLDRVISVGFDEQTGAAAVSRAEPGLAELALLGAGTAG